MIDEYKTVKLLDLDVVKNVRDGIKITVWVDDCEMSKYVFNYLDWIKLNELPLRSVSLSGRFTNNDILLIRDRLNNIKVFTN